MNKTTRNWLTIAGWLLLPLLAQGCTSSRAYQQALDDNEAEIRRLREERAQLKEQNRQLKSSLDSTRGELTNASATLPEAAPAKFPELDQEGITYGMRGGNMVISIPSSITFASGQATLSSEGRKALQKVASTLKKEYVGATYSIEGHTDSDPIKKSKFASNRELSVSRAMAVLTFLVEECAIQDEQCIVAGHGQYDALGPNDSDKNKARNRRVEIVVRK